MSTFVGPPSVGEEEQGAKKMARDEERLGQDGTERVAGSGTLGARGTATVGNGSCLSPQTLRTVSELELCQVWRWWLCLCEEEVFGEQ